MKAPSVFCSTLNTKIKTQLSANIGWFDFSLSHAGNFHLGNLPIFWKCSTFGGMCPCPFWMDWGRDENTWLLQNGVRNESRRFSLAYSKQDPFVSLSP